MKPILTSLILLLTAGLFPQAAATQELSKELRSQIGEDVYKRQVQNMTAKY